jgi:hypothetical protein
MKDTQIIYQEEDLDLVMSYFVKDYNTKFIDFEWFLDAAKNKVVFKLVVEK